MSRVRKTMFYSWMYWQCDSDRSELCYQFLRLMDPGYTKVLKEDVPKA